MMREEIEAEQMKWARGKNISRVRLENDYDIVWHEVVWERATSP